MFAGISHLACGKSLSARDLRRVDTIYILVSGGNEKFYCQNTHIKRAYNNNRFCQDSGK